MNAADKARALYEKGVNLPTEEALKCFEEAISINPNCAEAYNGIGACYAEKEEYDKAIAHFQKAIEINPDYPKALVNLGIQLLYSDQNSDQDKALEYFQKSVTKNPLAYYGLTLLYRERKSYQEALEACNTYISLAGSDNIFSYVLRAEIYFKNFSQADKALHDLNYALSVNENDSKALTLKGMIFHSQQKNSEAMALLCKAIEVAPESPYVVHARCALGAIYTNQQEFRKCIEVTEKALEIIPEHGVAKLLLAMALFHDAQYERANDLFDKILQDEPSSVESLLGKAVICFRNKDNSSAQNYVQRAFEISPDSSKVLEIKNLLNERNPDLSNVSLI